MNLGGQRELLTCHWDPPLLKKKLREPRDPQAGRAGRAAVATRLCRLEFPKPGPAPGPSPPRPTPAPGPAPSDCAASAPSQWEARNLQPGLQITAGSVRRATTPDRIDYLSPAVTQLGNQRETRPASGSAGGRGESLVLMAPGAQELCFLPLLLQPCRHG